MDTTSLFIGKVFSVNSSGSSSEELSEELSTYIDLCLTGNTLGALEGPAAARSNSLTQTAFRGLPLLLGTVGVINGLLTGTGWLRGLPLALEAGLEGLPLPLGATAAVADDEAMLVESLDESSSLGAFGGGARSSYVGGHKSLSESEDEKMSDCGEGGRSSSEAVCRNEIVDQRPLGAL